ncbi:hypothetical protein G9A89_005607 [Geosiphon pyriformis]|nr:hypothetical protein G9A89_005607 [Geosiphon pyriformis]
MGLLFNSTAEIIICIILQRTSTNNTKPKVAESEIIGTNHLGFAKFLFQQYNQQLGLNNNHYPAESAFNFYEDHFAPIIREINKEIERYTQRTFSITYQDKDKGKLQTPAVTSKGIQIPNWKKQRIESLLYPLYHHTSRSTINITSADASTSTKTPLVRITFQSKQKKNKLLGAYGDYFEEFKSRSPTPSEFRSLPHQPDFGIISLWKITESEKNEDEDQEFNYQNLVLEDLNIQTQQHLENSEIKTPNIQILSNQRNQNPELIQQQNLLSVIIINQPPIEPIAPQILNQFIRGLCSSILQHVRPLHLDTLQDAVTCARDFESAKSKTNHAQAVNLVINGSSELDSKLKKFIPKSKPTRLPTSNAVINLSISSVSSSNLSTAVTSNLSTTATTNNLSTPTNPNTTPKLTTQQNPKTKNDSTELEIDNGSLSTDPQFFTATIWIMLVEFSLLVTPEDASTNNPAFAQKQSLTSNILPVTITKDKSLAAIFPFEFEKTTTTPLFSGATLEAKPITMMYTNAKVKRQSIKLIFDSTNGTTKTPIGEIDDFSFEVNGIMTSIKVLVIEAIQYQALVGNDWLSKVNATLDWNTQKLQLIYQGQHIHVPAMCGHFKTPPREKLLIKLEEEKEKPIWEAYQVSWTNADYNELLSILSWNDNPKGKQKEKLTWETDNLT